MFYCLDSCEQCSKYGPANLPQLYLEYIENALLPKIGDLLKKYQTWWSFKPDSLLKAYMEEHNVHLNHHFTPNELCYAIFTICDTNYMYDAGNSQCIVLDEGLQKCFNQWTIFTPDLQTLCEPHVNVLSYDVCLVSRNTAIMREFSIDVPESIIYNDPSSLFWIHPELNQLLNNNKKITYSWKEINELFLDFCTSNRNFITVLHDDMFQINSWSILNQMFKMNFFHKSQIPDILKKCTFYLGKTNKLNTSCSKLQLTVTNLEFFNALDHNFNIGNSFLPFMYSIIRV